MKKVKVSIALFLLAIVTLEQPALLSMEQPQDQIIYINNNVRIFNGQLQEAVRHEYRKIDGTITVIEEWIAKQ
ncbi:MAG TPA: hypothetical protein VHO47_01860 [Candidatus Babeliales bacterium]|nr:hypothetical protein [Candidatus Babeliales bacterium]